MLTRFRRTWDKFHEGCHKALVDRELYHRVQDLIADRRTVAPRQRGGRATFPWVLRGILLCGKCCRPMGTHTVRFGPVIRYYYRCRSTAGGREAGKGVMISAGEVEAAVLTEIGVGLSLVSKEQTAKVKEVLRSVTYDPISNAELGSTRNGWRGCCIISVDSAKC